MIMMVFSKWEERADIEQVRGDLVDCHDCHDDDDDDGGGDIDDNDDDDDYPDEDEVSWQMGDQAG